MMLKIEKTETTVYTEEEVKWGGKLEDWLQKQLSLSQFTYFLAHTETGVIWGQVEGKTLTLSKPHELLPKPEASLERLHMARLFSTQAEWLLWRDGNGRYHTRLIQDPKTEKINNNTFWSLLQKFIQFFLGKFFTTPPQEIVFTEYMDEEQILWGTEATKLDNNFTLMSDGVQGLRHVVPIAVDLPKPVPTNQRPLRLRIRHYIGGDKHGRIVASRLCDLRSVTSKEQANEQNAETN